MDTDGNYINKCTGLSLSLSSAYTQTSLGDSSVTLTGDTAPGRDGTYQFSFETTLPIPIGGSLQLVLPTEIDLPTSGLSSVAISATSNLSAGLSLSTGSSDKVIVLNNAFSSLYVTEGSSVSFTLKFLRNPLSNLNTESFAFTSFDQAGYELESLDFGLTI